MHVAVRVLHPSAFIIIGLQLAMSDYHYYVGMSSKFKDGHVQNYMHVLIMIEISIVIVLISYTGKTLYKYGHYVRPY